MSLHSDTVSLFAGSGRFAKGRRSASGAPSLHQRCNVRTDMPISSQANCWRAPLAIASSTSLIIMPRFTVLVRHPRPLVPKSHECFFLELTGLPFQRVLTLYAVVPSCLLYTSDAADEEDS